MDAAPRRRLLVPLTYGLSVRYAVPTGLLEELQRRVQVVAALGWADPELEADLHQRGIETAVMPEAVLEHEYRKILRKLTLLHEHRLASPTSVIRRRRWKPPALSRGRLLYDLRVARDRLVTAMPGAELRLSSDAERELRMATNIGEFEQFLRAVEVDAVLSFTPYHDQDTLALHAAERAGLTTIVSIISFDNPTVRGRLPINPDSVAVWNEDNAGQVSRSHPRLPRERVQVVGAPQFDLHRQAWRIEPEAMWRSRLGLPSDGPIVLYGAGPSRLVPAEYRLVEVIDRAIDDGRIPQRPHLLVRPHPADPASVWTARRDRFRNATIGSPWATADRPLRSWPTDEDLIVQMSSLAHSAVHVNVASSMTVDGAMFDRPQIGPAFLPGANRRQVRRISDFYLQEHWQPIARSGGLVVASDPAELVGALRAALEDPNSGRVGRERLLEGVLTWPDGRSVQRLVDQVVQVLERLGPPEHRSA